MLGKEGEEATAGKGGEGSFGWGRRGRKLRLGKEASVGEGGKEASVGEGGDRRKLQLGKEWKEASSDGNVWLRNTSTILRLFSSSF